MRATCVIADDHSTLLDSLAALLYGERIEVLDRATTGAEAAELIPRHQPDFAIVDLRMRDKDGVEVARAVARRAPETSVILFTSDATRALAEHALESGARAVVLKQGSARELLHAIDAVLEGGIYVDAALWPPDSRDSSSGCVGPG